eukprot:m.82403 g.82403  ORF g.82403 m.82403 type:complete len:346 (-) comp16328_c0_seq1:232-1269(-)
MTISLDALLHCAPTLDVQIVLLSIFSFVWYVGICHGAPLFIAPYIRRQKWCHQWNTLNKLVCETSFFIFFDSEKESFDFACQFVVVALQHLTGGALCIPSLLWGPGEYTSALACIGALCEAGWEVQDTLMRFFQVTFGGESGRKQNPPVLVCINMLHHVMGLSMCIPMNLYYHDNANYHEFVFLMQFTAFIALSTQHYGYTLDVTKPGDLTRMKAAALLSFSSIVYSRVLRFGYVAYLLQRMFIDDGRMYFIWVGGFSACCMAIINLFFLGESVKKVVKFVVHNGHDDEDVLAAALEVQSALHPHGSTGMVKFTLGQKEWAKVRGAWRMGVLTSQQNLKRDKKIQ